MESSAHASKGYAFTLLVMHPSSLAYSCLHVIKMDGCAAAVMEPNIGSNCLSVQHVFQPSNGLFLSVYLLFGCHRLLIMEEEMAMLPVFPMLRQTGTNQGRRFESIGTLAFEHLDHSYGYLWSDGCRALGRTQRPTAPGHVGFVLWFLVSARAGDSGGWRRPAGGRFDLAANSARLERKLLLLQLFVLGFLQV
ncbi:hypothetical protein ZIOFF_050583 [Zingiber officinale]|uniref:Uncharacterized protein n=1 Tax=Zingiber officinale TaxID=94328 RepID=A0A8J5FKK5_ZINOF|nr:hypothetical protein ZIOFF_050583 [Zingiber officinale]